MQSSTPRRRRFSADCFGGEPRDDGRLPVEVRGRRIRGAPEPSCLEMGGQGNLGNSELGDHNFAHAHEFLMGVGPFH